MSVVEQLIPIAMFLCLLGGFAVFAFYRARWRSEQQTTLRQAIDKEQPLTEELIQALSGHSKSLPFRDLRRGLILLSIALSLFGFSIIVPDEEADSVFRGLALFPFMLGLAYLAMHRLGLEQE